MVSLLYWVVSYNDYLDYKRKCQASKDSKNGSKK